MNALGLPEQALVARTVAALRAQGWPTGRAVRLVADRLPPGPGREALAAVAADLEAGRAPATGDDPFVRLLAQGERLGPVALEDARKAAEAEQSLTQVWVRSAALPAGILGAFLALLTLGSFFVLGSFEHVYQATGGALPRTTEFLLWAGRHFRWLGPVLLVALVVGALRLPRSLLPGVRTMQTAARLRRWAAERTTGLAEPVPLSQLGTLFGLDRYETALLGQAGSLEDGARLLAGELEASARRWDQRAQVLGSGLSVFVTAALVCVLVVVLIGLYLPIFTLAGAIK